MFGERRLLHAITMGMAVLLVVTTVTSCTKDPVDTGPVVPGAHPDEVDGVPLRFHLPFERWAVIVGEPVTTIPARETVTVETITANEGEMFLPLMLTGEDALEGVGRMLPPVLETPLVKFTLEVSGQPYRLGSFGEISRIYVRVAAQEVAPEDLALVLESEGVTQRVSGTGERDAGAAADLYGDAAVHSANCAEGWAVEPDGATVDLLCSVRAGRTPYLPEHGWAADRGEGMTWVVVLSSTTFRRAELPGAEGNCKPWSFGEVSLTLDGATPEVDYQNLRGGTDWSSRVARKVAFLVPRADSGTLTVVRKDQCQLDRDRVDLVLRNEIPLDLAPESAG